MPILDLQRRARELGRIRIGQVQPTSSGKTRPAKLDRFRITSASRPLLERIAELYGGDVREWTPQNSKVAAWEVLTESTRLPILVPPQPVTQWYETWSGGGCQRRCDGVREVLKDRPCVCGPDPADRECKPTTRLNVVLREVEGIGVFRLETHGYYAAVELPMAAELLAQAAGYVSGFLALEERMVVRDGKTQRFMVPVLDIGITPQQLLDRGAAAPAALAGPAERPALTTGPAPAGKTAMSTVEEELLMEQITAVPSLAKLTELSRATAATFDVDPAGPIPDAFRQKARALQAVADAPSPPGGGEEGGDPDALWTQILTTCPEAWTTEQVEQDFAAFAEVPAEQASAADMRRYLAVLPERARTAS